MNLINRLICLIAMHDYRTVQVFPPLAARVVCDRCGGDWATIMHDKSPWNATIHSIYAERYRIIDPWEKEPRP
jgi:hypothetical protein